jgi:tRNA(Ile)-lysidine synthase
MKKVLAAVSGGPDSMAMLYKYKKIISGVCHVNYQKRLTAIRDQKIVEEFCNKNKIKLYVLNVTKKIYEQYKKQNNNFQNVARFIRYDFFLKIANKTKINTIYIAHNKTDFIETAYMQLERNVDTLFYGIKQKGNYQNLNIYRPLLNKTKKQLQLFCDKNKIAYGIDESNLLDIYKRNEVRKIINKWSNKELNSYYKKLVSKNKKLNKLEKKVNKNFQI